MFQEMWREREREAFLLATLWQTSTVLYVYFLMKLYLLIKNSNVKYHYETKYQKYRDLTGQIRKNKIEEKFGNKV